MRLALYAAYGCVAFGIGVGLCRIARHRLSTVGCWGGPRSTRHVDSHAGKQVDCQAKQVGCQTGRICGEPAPDSNTGRIWNHTPDPALSQQQGIGYPLVYQEIRPLSAPSSTPLNTITPNTPPPSERNLLVPLWDTQKHVTQQLVSGRGVVAELPEKRTRQRSRRRTRSKPPTPPEDFGGMDDSSADELLRRALRSAKRNYILAQPVLLLEVTPTPPREHIDPHPVVYRDLPAQPTTHPKVLPVQPQSEEAGADQPQQSMPVGDVAPTTKPEKPQYKQLVEELPADTYMGTFARNMEGDRISDMRDCNTSSLVAGAMLVTSVATAVPGQKDLASGAAKSSELASPELASTAIPETNEIVSLPSSGDCFILPGIATDVGYVMRRETEDATYTIVDDDVFAPAFGHLRNGLICKKHSSLPVGYGIGYYEKTRYLECYVRW